MGLARDAFRAVTLAAATGIAAGGAFGLLAPASAEAGATIPARSTATSTAAPRPAHVVTSVDLVGDLEITVRFTNTGSTVRHVDPAAITVTADGAPLGRLAAPPAVAVDLRPGASAEETVAFAAPPLTADLTLTLPDGARIPLEL
ncbi:hypothetical protein [Dactylosporangium sp. CA-233914]|uniref:hypothetical protein n=1 Tax=Dactylosporangium sp. CA-233914 TaxID=3239934 RepID=UPI003D93D8C5